MKRTLRVKSHTTRASSSRYTKHYKYVAVAATVQSFWRKLRIKSAMGNG